MLKNLNSNKISPNQTIQPKIIAPNFQCSEPARIGTRYKTVEARVEERAQLTCLATGELPLTLTWFDKEGKLVDKEDKRFM